MADTEIRTERFFKNRCRTGRDHRLLPLGKVIPAKIAERHVGRPKIGPDGPISEEIRRSVWILAQLQVELGLDE